MVSFFDISWSVCPEYDLIKPCICYNNNEIQCYANEYIDLVKIFQTLENNLNETQKHFHRFYLSNNFITELKENTFSDITFDVIYIYGCQNLKTIHRNAFNTTDSVTKSFDMTYNQALSLDNSFFEALSKFILLENLEIYESSITQIPSNAFQNIVGEQDKLKHIRFLGSSLKKLGNKAFSKLKNLQTLNFHRTSIDFIPENAFVFNERSEQQLTIEFKGNYYLNSSGFSEKSLIKLKRPTTLTLNSFGENERTYFKYLDQKIYEPFLLSNAKNMIKFEYGSLDCTNCKNQWLQTAPSTLLNQIYGLKCYNDKPLNDTINFMSCKDNNCSGTGININININNPVPPNNFINSSVLSPKNVLN